MYASLELPFTVQYITWYILSAWDTQTIILISTVSGWKQYFSGVVPVWYHAASNCDSQIVNCGQPTTSGTTVLYTSMSGCMNHNRNQSTHNTATKKTLLFPLIGSTLLLTTPIQILASFLRTVTCCTEHSNLTWVYFGMYILYDTNKLTYRSAVALYVFFSEAIMQHYCTLLSVLYTYSTVPVYLCNSYFAALR